MTTSSITCLVLEPEPASQSSIAYLLARFFPQVRLIGVTGEVDTGRRWIWERHPDLLIVESDLKGGSGWDLPIPATVKGVLYITVPDQEHTVPAPPPRRLVLYKPLNIPEFRSAFATIVPKGEADAS